MDMTKAILMLCSGVLSGAAVTVNTQAADWFPIEVDVWEPPFNTQRQRVEKSYAVARASKPSKAFRKSASDKLSEFSANAARPDNGA